MTEESRDERPELTREWTVSTKEYEWLKGHAERLNMSISDFFSEVLRILSEYDIMNEDMKIQDAEFFRLNSDIKNLVILARKTKVKSTV